MRIRGGKKEQQNNMAHKFGLSETTERFWALLRWIGDSRSKEENKQIEPKTFWCARIQVSHRIRSCSLLECTYLNCQR